MMIKLPANESPEFSFNSYQAVFEKLLPHTDKRVSVKFKLKKRWKVKKYLVTHYKPHCGPLCCPEYVKLSRV